MTRINTLVIALGIGLLTALNSAQDSTPTDNQDEIYSRKVCGCTNCRRDLGMFSGDIDDSALSSSSSFNHRTTGPHNARIRTEKNGGAWCPNPQIHDEVYEWLQVDLQNLTVITHVETQGRFGNGQGQEFAPQYMLEYQRQPGDSWIRFTDKSGEHILDGNQNTYIPVMRELRPPVIARALRFVPYSQHLRTICMRVELYGCPWTDGTEAYEMRQGDTRGSEVDFFDFTYDGNVTDGYLSGGLGQLIDFEEGDKNFRHDVYDIGKKGFEWLGWKNETPHTEPVDLIFAFDGVRNFTTIKLHAHNYFSKDVRVFRRAKVYFSIGGEYYTSSPVVYDYMSDDLVEYARYVTITVPHKIGAFVKIRLYYADRWIMLSEIRFENEIAAGIFEDEEAPPPTTPSTAPPPGVHSIGESTHSPAHEFAPGHAERDDTYIAILIGTLAALFVLSAVIIIALLIRRRQKHVKYNGSPLKMFIGHDHVNFHLHDANNGKFNNGNVYKGVGSDDSDSYVKDDSLTKLTSSINGECAVTSYRDGIIQARKLPELPLRGEQDGSEYASTDITNYPNLVVNLPPTPIYKSGPRDESPPPPPPPPHPHAMCAAMGTSPDLNIQGLVGNSVYAVPSELLLKEEFAVMDFPRHNLRFMEKLGQGQFGEVHLCEAMGIPDYLGDDFLVNRTANSNSMLVAVKTLRCDACIDARQDFHKEVQIMSRLNDPNVVSVLGASMREDPMLVVVEYMRYGDLNHFLKQHVPESTLTRNKNYLTYGSMICMATQIASGMKYLETLNMVHRDLATRNCLVGNNYQVKISDFGMSRSLYSRDYYRIEGKAVLPIRWMSWESVLLGKFSTRSDVWSFAITLWEILIFARQQPYDGLTDDQVIENCGHYYRNNGQQVTPACPSLCPKEIYDLMCECWNRDELQRPSFREIHMFLQRKNMGYDPKEEAAIVCKPVV